MSMFGRARYLTAAVVAAVVVVGGALADMASGQGWIGDALDALIGSERAVDLPSYGPWEVLSDGHDFDGRDGSGVLELGGALYMLGGWTGEQTNNEVWKSTNGGLTWAFLGNAPWEGRHTAGWEVFNGKLWVLGGDVNSGHYQKDIWSSPDGVNWTMVLEVAPWADPGRVLFYSCVHDGKLWVIGGQTLDSYIPNYEERAGLDDPFYADVWSSPDGVNWTKVSDNNPWAPRGAILGSVVQDGKMWLLGGGTYDTVGYPNRMHLNSVWSSLDGIVWELELAEAPWGGRIYHQTTVFDGRMWVVAGHDGANLSDVWHSKNGKIWQKLPPPPWGARHALSLVVRAGDMMMMLGHLDDKKVWRLEAPAH